MTSISKIAGAGLIVALLMSGCPAEGTDAGTDTDMGMVTGRPAMAGYRAAELRILVPPTLGVVNGLLATAITDEEVNVLMRTTMFDTLTPSVEVAEGTGDSADPSVTPSTIFTIAGPTSTMTADYDEATNNLVTNIPGVVIISLSLDTDGDGVDDLFVTLNLQTVPGEPMLDMFFDPTDWSITNDSRITGALTVEDACAISVDLGTGTPLNILDILDGSTGDTTPPNTTPGMCAAGTGTDNIQPDIDVDGDGTMDAYRVNAQTSGSMVMVVN